jgi:hypothetical protein
MESLIYPHSLSLSHASHSPHHAVSKRPKTMLSQSYFLHVSIYINYVMDLISMYFLSQVDIRMVVHIRRRLGEGFVHFMVILCSVALFRSLSKVQQWVIPHTWGEVFKHCSILTILLVQAIFHLDVHQPPAVCTKLQANTDAKLQCNIHQHCCRT